jgi:RNase P/RNase MRP subunit POP5
MPWRAGRRASRRGRRYIVFEVLGTEPVKFEELRDAIMGTVRRVYGELGEARLRVKLIEYDEVRRRGILRVRREFKLQALAVLGLTRDFNGRRLLLVPISTTGSLKRARALVRELDPPSSCCYDLYDIPVVDLVRFTYPLFRPSVYSV